MFLGFSGLGSSKFFRHVRIHIITNCNILAECKVFEAFIKNSFNLSLRVAFFQCRNATFRFDSFGTQPKFFHIVQQPMFPRTKNRLQGPPVDAIQIQFAT